MQHGTRPIYTHQLRTGHRYIPTVCLDPSSHLLAAGYAHLIDILLLGSTQQEFSCVMQLDAETDVSQVKQFSMNLNAFYGKQKIIFIYMNS